MDYSIDHISSILCNKVGQVVHIVYSIDLLHEEKEVQASKR